MKLLGLVTRKQVVDFYIRTDAAKKCTPLPPNSLDFEDANALDCWFERNGYKPMVLTAFRSWAHVRPSLDDLLDLAVINRIFKSSRVLRRLIGAEFASWQPNKTPFPIWYALLSQGYFDDDFTIILRAATPGERREGARLYVEDGSGRSICYTRAINAGSKQSEMKAFIGFDPDPSSTFLNSHLEREFVGDAAKKYSTFEQMIKTTGQLSEPECNKFHP